MYKQVLLGCTCLTAIGSNGAHADVPVLPSGGAFAAGNGAIHQDASSFTINQASINAVMSWRDFSIGAGGSVHFNNGGGATLNRVTGDAASMIDGNLSATGSLYLMNPNGVVVGPEGTVRTGGSFAATTLEADEETFMSTGRLSLSGQSDAQVVNLGKIAASGGNIVLAARHVRNDGAISASGQGALVAATEVVISDTSADASILVRTGPSGDAVNSGAIEAAVVRLEAAGGNVYALAGNTEGVIRAAKAEREGGRVVLRAAGRVEINARIEAAGGAGGDGGVVVAEAEHVHIGGGAHIDASGAEDGGTINIGGGWQGRDPDIRNASSVTVEAGARINADGRTGSGGTVSIWSNGTTEMHGAISARGDKGAGGRIETSGKRIKVEGKIDAGKGGLWLLDPDDLDIDAGLASTISSTLEGGANVTQQTTESGSGGSGDITVSSDILWTSSASLTLSAYRNITVSAAISSSGGGGVELRADNTGNGTGAVTFDSGGSIATTGNVDILYNPLVYSAPVNLRALCKQPEQ